jgi:hypothetical protein
MVTWYPDFCPTGQCMIELEKANGSLNWTNPKSFLSTCPHHAGLGLSDQQRFEAILQSSRVKEKARAAVKRELGLDKEHPGVPYRTNADGSFTVFTDPAVLGWTAPDGSIGTLPTIRNNDRNRARSAALLESGLVEQRIGMSTVTVE